MRTLPGGRNAIERIARFGYGARGVVYIVVGALALLRPWGMAARPATARTRSAPSWPGRSARPSSA